MIVLILIELLTFQKLVVKPDQLIKRRGKLGLIKVNVDLETVKTWISERMDQEQKVSCISLFVAAICILNGTN